MAKSLSAGLIAAIAVGLAGIISVGIGVAMMLRPPELRPYRDVPGGDVARGRQALVKYNCGSCHKIAGVEGANGTKGQPLAGLAHRYDIVGALPNTPEDLARWIRKPKSIYPETGMPDLNVTQQDAVDIVAYLYCLPP